MKFTYRAALASVFSVVAIGSALAQEKSDIGQWYVSPGVGVIVFEGNNVANAAPLGLIRLGYDATEHLSFEFGAIYGPRLTQSDQSKYTRQDFRTTWAWGVSADVIYHFSRMERLDPYLSAGAMYMSSPQDVFNEHNYVIAPRVGGGLLWHWTDNVSLRANMNFGVGILNKRLESFPIFDLGMVYRFGGAYDNTGASETAYDGYQVVETVVPVQAPDPDVIPFELQLEFGYDETVIRPEYYSQLDVIAKVLTRYPNATAVIEGHADRRAKSSAKYNQELSEKRANAVLNYLASKGIQNQRLRAAGFGFTRPKVRPDLVNGNPENRRVEVLIRGAGKAVDKEAVVREATLNAK